MKVSHAVDYVRLESLGEFLKMCQSIEEKRKKKQKTKKKREFMHFQEYYMSSLRFNIPYTVRSQHQCHSQSIHTAYACSRRPCGSSLQKYRDYKDDARAGQSERLWPSKLVQCPSWLCQCWNHQTRKMRKHASHVWGIDHELKTNLPRPSSASLRPSTVWWKSKTSWARLERNKRPSQSKPDWKKFKLNMIK